MRKFNKYTIDEFEKFIATVPVNRAITNLQIHHTYRPTLAQYRAAPDKERIIYGMWNYHVTALRWRDIAQHFSLAPDGVWDGRILDWNPGGFLGAENAGGICFEIIGNYDTDRESFTGDIAEVTHRATAAVLKRWDIDIRFHREQPSARGKTCPGTSIVRTVFINDVMKYLRPKSGMEFIVDKVPFSSGEAWIRKAETNPALKEVADAIAKNWEELPEVGWMQAWMEKVGEIIGN